MTLRPLPSRTNPKPFFFGEPRQPVAPCPACAAGSPTVARVPVHVGDDLVVWMTPGRAATLRAEIAKLARELAEAEAAELGRS